MIELHYTLSFTTPAFLGNAEQQAQWRTPPFKALIRQWWRVVKAKEVSYDHTKLRTEEMRLFGAASDSGSEKSHRSLVRLRLSSWAAGELTRVSKGDKVSHQEVPGGEVGANLYLGYGPIGGSIARSAIKPGEPKSELEVRCPDDLAGEIHAALQLAAWFGTLGSRSRNGWGALQIEGGNIKGFSDLNIPALSGLIAPRSLTECLQVEWLHAIGCDARAGTPLVWRLLKVDREKKHVPFGSWEEVMRELARIKIAVRTSGFFKFDGGGGHVNPQPRHILSYPSGSSHKVNAKAWGQNGRLANQVLFKVHRRGSGFAATIAHFPSGLPAHMAAGLQLPDQKAVWKEVHRLLDAEKANGLSRIEGAQA